MKRTLSAILMMCIVLSVIIIPITALAETSWAMGYVDFCVNQGLFRDKTRTSITETQKTKRQEVAYALMKIEGVNASNNVPPLFSDLVESSYYIGAINWAYQYGIMNGTGNGQFNPSGNITKQDLAVTIYRYLLEFSVNSEEFRVNKGTLNSSARDSYLNGKYHDAASISSYARDAVYELSCIGLITGSDAGYFTPLTEIPLIEAACMFTRAHGYRYNKTDSINVYVRSYTGSEYNNVAVAYLAVGSGTSYGNDKNMQVRKTTNGIANLVPEDKLSGTHYYVNAMSQYTSTFSPDAYPPSPFYQFLTIPRNEADYELTSSYDRSTMYGHGDEYVCEEPSWSFPQWCPTDLMHSGQNFGWRYNGGVVFHQGMDYGCYYETIYNTTDKDFIVVSSGNDFYLNNGKGSMGNYIKVRVKNTNDYLMFMHLSSYSTVQNGYAISANGGTIGVTGNTGSSTAPHLHLQLVRGNSTLNSTNDLSLMHYFCDPRIYFK